MVVGYLGCRGDRSVGRDRFGRALAQQVNVQESDRGTRVDAEEHEMAVFLETMSQNGPVVQGRCFHNRYSASRLSREHAPSAPMEETKGTLTMNQMNDELSTTGRS